MHRLDLLHILSFRIVQQIDRFYVVCKTAFTWMSGKLFLQYNQPTSNDIYNRR